MLQYSFRRCFLTICFSSRLQFVSPMLNDMCYLFIHARNAPQSSEDKFNIKNILRKPEAESLKRTQFCMLKIRKYSTIICFDLTV